MSYIIQYAEQIPSIYQQFRPINNNLSFKHHQEIQNSQIREREMFIKNLANLASSVVQIRISRDEIVLQLGFDKIYKHISVISTILICKKNCQLRLLFKLLNVQNLYMLVESKERRKLITKTLCNCLYQNRFTIFKISLHHERGTIKIQTRIYQSQDLNYRTFQRQIQQIIINFREELKNIYQSFQNILQISNETGSLFAQATHNKLNDIKIQRLYHLSKIINVSINLESENTQQETLINEYMKKESESIEILKSSHVQLNKNMVNIILYQPVNLEIFQKTDFRHFQINFMERERLEDRVKMPSLQKAKNPHENAFVLNYIRVNKKLSETCLRKINSGGFTSIYLSQIEYWYVGSYTVGVLPSQDIMKQTNAPPHKKYIIIKRQDKNTSQTGKSRIAHERFILQMIKNGLSMFLPKYYLLAEKDNSYENDLLVDYINYPNLSQYISKNSETMSLQTKLYLVIMITQGLRYLQEYKIAHLDLKPTNIMMNRKLTIKLIDFGESYHPQVKNHQPGFSMPYSAPENYNLPETYNYKNDVFSLGIILYELLMGRYPFYIYSQKLREECYRHGQVHRYWLNAPEQDAMNGEHMIFPILRHLIEKCMHPMPQFRPELEWIVLILRDCLDYFY